ncbi:tripartite tricarboxylate transporter substrate binding protein [Hydrogenophaga sp. BPS33]|uniref:tripartite tricarboxylate transporter substrate binding protein n=1 Tax=Hydrogenophaga sp. BPS33 TaxID=2651974 RepID=UPI0013201414|nr:tripartite tricarboxylate transporter substrate binding protein [Hydrogenophaga sp. BPS33]QHE86877.1 tripartite tricarboxylate transporter substrate binding protein [Hydrogenophaga sp. BPS33]
MKRRRLLLAAAALGGAAIAHAQSAAPAGTEWPRRPVRFVVVYPPGGGIDLIARNLAQQLSELWRVPVVVENRPGAGTTLGAGVVAKAPADGYTVLMTDVSFAIAPGLYKSLPYDTLRDFAPITLLNTVDDILVVNPSVPANNVRELIALAKAKPGALMYASAGNGTLNHLAPEMFKKAAGIEMAHVPYKGALAALADVMAGQVQVYLGALGSVVPQIKAGRLKPIAVTGTRRSPVLPEVPTAIESGVPGYDVSAWYGLLAPAGTPDAIVAKIQRDVARFAREPAFRQSLAADGNEVVAGTPAEFARFLESDIAKWRKAVADAGAKVD